MRKKKVKIKRKKVKSTTEKQIITGMIVSDKILKEVSLVYQPQLMTVPYARRIAGWCLKYYKKYKVAPKIHIQDIYHTHMRKGHSPDEMEMVGDFLATLSSEYERADKFNEQYILDKADELFKKNSLLGLAEDLQSALVDGGAKEAEQVLTDYKKVERPSSDDIDPYTDTESVRQAFEDTAEPLFTIPGAIGSLLNDFLVRDSLIGIMGREKIGKTWNAYEFAHRARMARCNVAVFEAGDMSKPQSVKRFHIRQAGRSDKRRYCEEILVPVLDCERNQQNTCKKEKRKCKVGLEEDCSFEDAPKRYRVCTYCHDKGLRRFKGAVWYKIRKACKPLTWRDALKLSKRKLKFLKGKHFKLSCHPNGTLSVGDIDSKLAQWEEESGFIPDVIVIDYADILRPEGKDEYRHGQNEIWKGLRKLSQKWHCLVIAPTQADAASYETTTLKLKNFNEDKRKYSHVTAFIGLNQTEDEKSAGVMRMNVLLARSEDYDINHCVTVLQCLQMGKPWIASYW